MNYEEQIELTQKKIKGLNKAINRLRIWRSVLMTFGAAIVLTAFFSWLLNFPKLPESFNNYKQYVHLSVALIGLFITLASFLLSDDTLKIRRAKLLGDLSAYSALKSYSATHMFIETLGQVVLSQLTQYYQFVLTNVQRSSRLATTLMLTGFILIFFGLWLSNEHQEKDTLSYISTASGVLLEFLTSTILLHNKENITLMDKYMSKLESFSQILLALSLLDTSSSSDDKEKMRRLWFTQLVHVLSPTNSAPLISTPTTGAR